jgi:hypothetical protein
MAPICRRAISAALIRLRENGFSRAFPDKCGEMSQAQAHLDLGPQQILGDPSFDFRKIYFARMVNRRSRRIASALRLALRLSGRNAQMLARNRQRFDKNDSWEGREVC